MAEETTLDTAVAPNGERKRPIGRIVIVALVLVAALFGIRNWLWSRNHESTDNAQIAGDVVLVAPLVGGTVSQILVEDNALVKKGQAIVKLDPAKLEAAVAQAKANLAAAVSDANAAGVSVQYAAATSAAGQATASGGADEAGADVGAAQSAALAAQATVQGLQAQAQAAASEAESSVLDRKLAGDALMRARASLESAQADRDWAKSAVGQADAAYASAVATHELAQKELARIRTLVEQGAESRQNLETAIARERTTSEAVAAAKSNRSMTEATVKVKESALRSAASQLAEAESLVRQSEVRIGVARQKAASAQAGVTAAKFQASASRARIGTAVAHRATVHGQVLASKAQDLNVEKLRADQKQAVAKVEQARAALRTAEIDLSHTTVYAPCDGRVSRRSVEVGSSVQVGTAMLYLVPSESVYVVANFKETQVGRMDVGDKVEVEVDALPGLKLRGQVDSLSAATGATFALLPPDNSTGNFVKVVQRVPVRVKLAGQAAVDPRLRVGMSVVVSVELK